VTFLDTGFLFALVSKKDAHHSISGTGSRPFHQPPKLEVPIRRQGPTVASVRLSSSKPLVSTDKRGDLKGPHEVAMMDLK